MDKESKDIGFLEKQNADGTVEKSSTNLINVIVAVTICLVATATESATQLKSINSGTFHAANWEGIAILCGAILIGVGATKISRNLNLNSK